MRGSVPKIRRERCMGCSRHFRINTSHRYRRRTKARQSLGAGAQNSASGAQTSELCVLRSQRNCFCNKHLRKNGCARSAKSQNPGHRSPGVAASRPVVSQGKVGMASAVRAHFRSPGFEDRAGRSGASASHSLDDNAWALDIDHLDQAVGFNKCAVGRHVDHEAAELGFAGGP